MRHLVRTAAVRRTSVDVEGATRALTEVAAKGIEVPARRRELDAQRANQPLARLDEIADHLEPLLGRSQAVDKGGIQGGNG